MANRVDTLYGMTEIIEKQSDIIKAQDDAIKDLFRLLEQYVTAEELDNIPSVQKAKEIQFR